MAKKSSFANAIMDLPWIVRVLLAIFLDCVYGIARFIDGLQQKNILKALIGSTGLVESMLKSAGSSTLSARCSTSDR